MWNYQREYKRIDYQQQIQLTAHDGLQLFAKAKNLSMGGLELVCNQETAKAMMPFGYQLDPDTPLLLTLEFCLSDSKVPLQAICRVKNMRRLAQDAFSFHLTFTEFQKTGKQMLERFMEQ